MDAIEAARALGKAIQQDSRYLRVMETQKVNDEDAGLQEKINSFNVLRGQLNSEVQKTEKDAEKIKAMDVDLKDLYREIFENENMAAFTVARNEFQQMLTFVNQIISGSAGGQNPDTIEYQESCGGDCGGCSGCS